MDAVTGGKTDWLASARFKVDRIQSFRSQE